MCVKGCDRRFPKRGRNLYIHKHILCSGDHLFQFAETLMTALVHCHQTIIRSRLPATCDPFPSNLYVDIKWRFYDTVNFLFNVSATLYRTDGNSFIIYHFPYDGKWVFGRANWSIPIERFQVGGMWKGWECRILCKYKSLIFNKHLVFEICLKFEWNSKSFPSAARF